MIDMHHIISDGMSMGTFINEFTKLYNGKQLEELTHQFKDYSEWMNRRDLSDQREYWISEFRNEIPVLDLPLDYQRPKEQRFVGAIAGIETDKAFGRNIKALARRTGTTEYMVFLASAFVLLGRYANVEDVIIGSPISGRTHKDTEQMLGMFVNTLAMRGRPESDKSFEQLLAEVKASSLKAYEHQEYPFEELVESVEVVRDLSRNPLFDVMLVMQNNEETEFGLEGASAEYTGVASRIAKFDLTFNIWEIEGSYGIGLEYCTALFKQETVALMLKHYVELLSNLMERPNDKLKEISMVSKDEAHQIIGEFNDTYMDYPRDKTVVQLFEDQVKKTPDHLAIVFEDEQLTYHEFNMQANILAHKLRTFGIGPDDYVGIIAERSVQMLIGIYGIIKSGGAYVPLDPNYPIERIQYMLEDCRPKVVLTYRSEIATEIPVIDLAELETWEGATENPVHINKPSDLLYLIYTSGTTGRPKGVMIEHNSIINFCYHGHIHPLVSELRDKCEYVYASNKIIFDITVQEIFLPLLNGLGVIVAKDPMMFHEVKQKNIGLISTPSKFSNYLLQPKFKEKLEDIKVIMLGGEEFKLNLLSGISIDSSCTILNGYGPTETTCGVLYYRVGAKENMKSVPIGYPISNTQIYMMNGDTLCGIGVPGELCIAGDGVARGYLNQSELTAEKFVDNPYGDGKLYRTGDLARWLADGSVEYLGRMDEQVKIRGFRIELGEVESTIRELEEINDCAVIVKEDSKGEKAINAYLASDNELNVSRIRDSLTKTLPEHMIPTYMMQIDAIPLTKNGKLDKRALPEIEVRIETEYIAPQNGTEVLIVNAFKEILGVEKVGVMDNIFELGGDSIKALRIAGLINDPKLNVRLILEEKTPRRIATKLRDPFLEGIMSLMNHNNNKHHTKPQLFLLPSLEGFSYEFNSLIDEMKYDGVIYGINDPKFYAPNPNKLDDPGTYTVKEIFAEIVKVFRDGDILIGYSYGGKLLPMLADLLEKSGKIISKIIVLDTVINLPEEFYREDETDLSLELAKSYTSKYVSRAYTMEAFGITSEEIIKKIAVILSENSSESVERIYEKINLSVEVELMNVRHNVTFQSKIKADIIGIFTRNLMHQFSEKCLEWGSYTSGSFTYEIIDCEHKEVVTQYANQTAKLLTEMIRHLS